MAQFLRPDADQATGSWSATPLWSKVDEGSPGDDTTIASADNSSPDDADLRLSDPAASPVVDTGHILRAAWNKSAAGGHAINAVLELWQGVPGTGSLVATLSVTNIGDTEVVSTYTLSTGEAANISDYTDLYLRVSRQGDTGGPPGNRRSLVVDFVELEVPDSTQTFQKQFSETVTVGAAVVKGVFRRIVETIWPGASPPITDVVASGYGTHSAAFVSSAGAVYVITSFSNAFSAWKKPSDYGKTTASAWTEFASGSGDTQVTALEVRQDADKLHIVYQRKAGVTDPGAVYYMCFDMSTDTWTTVNSQVRGGMTNAPTAGYFNVDLVVRSGGEIVGIYNGDKEDVGGTLYERAVGFRGTPGSWTADIALGATGVAADWPGGTCALGASDRVHFFLEDVTNRNYYQRTLRANNTLETLPSSFETDSRGFRRSRSQGVSYDDGGTTKVRFVGGRSAGQPILVMLDSADTPTVSVEQITSRQVALSTIFTGVLQKKLAVLSTNLFYMFHEDSGVTSAPLWLFRKDTSWDSGQPLGLWADENRRAQINAFTIGGLTVFAFVYYDGTNTLYAELGTPHVAQQFAKLLTASFGISESKALTAGKMLAAAFSVAASARKLAHRVLLATLTPTLPVLKKVILVPFAQSVTVAAGVTTTLVFMRTFSESVSAGESLTRSARKALAEALAATETRTAKVAVVLAAPVLIGAAITRSVAKGLAETVSASEVYGATRDLHRSFAEGLSAGESLVRSARLALAESLSPTDGVSRRVAVVLLASPGIAAAVAKRAAVSLAETVGVAEVLTSAKKFLLLLSESVAAGDSVARSVGKAWAETMTPADSLAKRAALVLVATVTVSAVGTARFLVRLLLTAGVSVGAAVTRGARLSLSATVGVAAAVRRGVGVVLAVPMGIAAAVTKAASRRFSETVSPSLALARQVRATLQESVSVADGINKSAQLVLAATLGVSAAATRRARLVLAGAVGIGESVVRAARLRLAAAVGVVGVVRKGVARALAATVSVAASPRKLAGVAIAATLTVVAAPWKLARLTLTATTSVGAALWKRARLVLPESVVTAAGFTKQVLISTVEKLFTETASVSAGLTRTVRKGLTGSLNVMESVRKGVAAAYQQGLSVAAGVMKRARLVKTAALTGSASLRRLARLGLAEILSPAESVVRGVRIRLAATPGVAAAVVKRIRTSAAESLTVAASRSATARIVLAAAIGTADAIRRTVRVVLRPVITIVGGFFTPGRQVLATGQHDAIPSLRIDLGADPSMSVQQSAVPSMTVTLEVL